MGAKSVRTQCELCPTVTIYVLSQPDPPAARSSRIRMRQQGGGQILRTSGVENVPLSHTLQIILQFLVY